MLGFYLGSLLRVGFFLECGGENYIMPEIMASYCSHTGMPLRSCARAMISESVWMAAFFYCLRWDVRYFCGG